jgi:phage terminase large subunit-like protein
MAVDKITRQWIRSRADELAVKAGCRFDLGKADRVRTFFTKFLRHSKGKFAGQPFELQDWQWREIVAPLFGWQRPDGTRRYRVLSCWVPKKQGKSTLAAAFVLYLLVADGEKGAEVYSAAADRGQASLIFREAANMVAQAPELAGHLQIVETTKRIVFARSRSYYEVLSKDSKKTGHGKNASATVIDEVHVVDREMWQTLRYGGAARTQPLFFEISTAGNDTQTIGYDRYTYARQVARGEIEDPDTLAVVYEADSADAWEDPEQWEKANPSLGVTVSLESFEADFREAKQSTPAIQNAFKQLRLNLWCETRSAWLAVEEWDACQGAIELDRLLQLPAYGGLDLSSRLDLTAWVLLFLDPETGEYWVRPRFWAPEKCDSRRQKANKALLQPWIAAGLVTATPGSWVDYDQVEREIQEDVARFDVRKVAFDPANAGQIAQHLSASGLEVVQFSQHARYTNEPMQEFERLVTARQIHHDGNGVLRWMLRNVIVHRDGRGLICPDKSKSQDKIDGITSSIMALALAMQAGGGDDWYKPGCLTE